MRCRVALHASWEEEIFRAIESCPAPASAGWDLYRYFADEGEDLEVAIGMAARDPLLATQLIRYANAAEFGSRGVSSLHEAASSMGLERLGRLALSYAFRGIASEPLRVYGFSPDEFFFKSVACGAAMERLYRESPGGGQDKYTLGLLHAIGEVFIDAAVRSLVEDPLRLVGATPKKLSAIEESFLGTNQARVAGMALRAWGFPERMVGPIEQQFAAAPGSRHFELAQSLMVARYVADKALEARRGVRRGLAGKAHIEYRGQLLSNVFDYALGQCERVAESVAAA